MSAMRTRIPCLLVAVVSLTACGAGADDAAVTVTEGSLAVVESTTTTGPVETTTTTVAETTTTAAETTTTAPGGIDVTVAGGEVDVSGAVSVPAGEEVVIRVVSDVAEHVHVHGYDLMADVGPDQPAEITFAADVPGIFEVELEDSGQLLFNLEVGA